MVEDEENCQPTGFAPTMSKSALALGILWPGAGQPLIHVNACVFVRVRVCALFPPPLSASFSLVSSLCLWSLVSVAVTNAHLRRACLVE